MSRSPSRRALLLGGGGALAAMALVASSLAPSTPGRLVAAEPSITWQSPEAEGPEAGRAEVHFLLRNVGGEPVRVRSVSQPCACAEQALSADLVPPGEEIALKVRPRPSRFGERLVPIEVVTDSPVAPVVGPTLHVVGSRRPPFLNSVEGESAFRDPLVGAGLEFVARTVEATAEAGPAPAVRSTLPFLDVRPVGSTVEPTGEPVVSDVRTWTYRAEIASPPPDPAFFGEILVGDPWNPGNERGLFVRGDAPPALRLVPARLVARGPDDWPKSFVVISGAGDAPAPIQAEPVGEGNPLRVEPQGEPGAAPLRFAGRRSSGASPSPAQGEPGAAPLRFAVGPRPGEPPRPGVHRIEVRAGEGGPVATLLVLIPEAER